MLNLWRKENNGWRIFAVFDIGIGRKDSTPVGSFVIRHRLRHPKWHGPDGRIFDYKDPENPLGDYFLKLQANNKKSAASGYGIHGSADDGSVGRSFSSGCIRMRNADVEMLYYLLPERTPVEITD
jgi:lipoprotein-anchoring transpeptidase ErfK/SrfK